MDIESVDFLACVHICATIEQARRDEATASGVAERIENGTESAVNPDDGKSPVAVPLPAAPDGGRRNTFSESPSGENLHVDEFKQVGRTASQSRSSTCTLQ